MKNPITTAAIRGLFGALLTATIATAIASPGAAATLYGDARTMGAGSVRSYVEFDAEGKPAAIGIEMDAHALAGLPPLKNATSRCFDLNKNGKIDGPGECEGDLEIKISLPAKTAKRKDFPFRWIGLNWNAEGHAPPPWMVPHFDFHFYAVSRAEVAMIRVGGCNIFIHCDDLKRALMPVPGQYVAPGHVNVKAAVSKMGNHLIDVRTPELADPPKRGFTHTWIYGAYDGRITFYEPMITLAFLMSRPAVCTPIREPKAWARAGYYPTRYCIRYRRDSGATTVSLEGMIQRAAK